MSFKSATSVLHAFPIIEPTFLTDAAIFLGAFLIALVNLSKDSTRSCFYCSSWKNIQSRQKEFYMRILDEQGQEITIEEAIARAIEIVNSER